ncbi:hypothetical protein [Oceanobacillus oncorhynchi]|uniref:hypothetical protein n=1 Tax=Oceanobacillus oncorhynchi TaxID=545501 RepID=UPI0018678D46|nr:hypothetical protein [Oceanobacillus oncorhynchi]
MFIKKKNTIEFPGTLEEFVTLLYDLDFWETNKKYQEFITNEYYPHFRNKFDVYTANLDSKRISLGKGRMYPGDNKPSCPDEIIVKIKSEGYTQQEINNAIYETLKKLEKQRNQKTVSNTKFKEFYIRKYEL